jgi:hypothetical protein
MAATTDITVNNNAAVAVVFKPSVTIKNGSRYMDAASSLGAPRTLDVTHVMNGPSSTSNDVHVVRFQQSRANGVAQIRTGYGEVRVSVPKDGLTATDIQDLGAFIRNSFTDAFLQSILLGQK